MSLHLHRRISEILSSAEHDTTNTVIEDYWSALFHDFDEEQYSYLNYNNGICGEPDVPSDNELEERASNHCNGGIDGWDYDSPFAEVNVEIDGVDKYLNARYIREANIALDRVLGDVASRLAVMDDMNEEGSLILNMTITPLDCVQTFITSCLLEKLKQFANKALHSRKQKLTTADELVDIIALHVLCASYNESATTNTSDVEEGNFLRLPITARRYFEVWSALSGCKQKRTSVEHSATGWSRYSNKATAMITEIENEKASINRDLVYVQGASILSLDDDHLRMASRAVTNLSNLQQHNNPKKGLGPVGNALCSALNSFFIACHFTRRGEKLIDTWVRLAQLLQGVSTTGALRKMPDDIWAADRGYNSSETVLFVTDALCSNLIGTHKRDMSYPFVFGDGAISRSHRGMIVSEKGCRSVYTAKQRKRGSSTASRNNFLPTDVSELQTAFTAPLERATRSEQRVLDNAGLEIEKHLMRVHALTVLQSEDPIWFILRAFRFTSRTSHSFLVAVARDYESRTRGLSWCLRGKVLAEGAVALSEDVRKVTGRLQSKWDCVLELIGIQKRAEVTNLAASEFAASLQRWSRSRLLQNTRQYLRDMVATLGGSFVESWSKAQLATELERIKLSIHNGELDISALLNPNVEPLLPEMASTEVRRALMEASVGAWIMKPLVVTQCMREGSWNEMGLKIKHIRAVGLIESASNPMMADSPDAIATALDECGFVITFAVEVKTMTADTRIEKAKDVRDKFASFTVLENLLTNARERKIFHDVVPKTEYRTQVLHHAATLGLSFVLYVVATGGSITEGRIVYACLLKFNDVLRHSYTFCLDCVKASAFEWVGGEAKHIPREYDDMLKDSQASDLFSFSSYYSLGRAVRTLIEDRRMPIPPARMIRLTPTVFWNHVKGGVDLCQETSRHSHERTRPSILS